LGEFGVQTKWAYCILSCMNPPLHHLRAFVAVGRELHFGHAADTLNISQPALSRQIKGLERELGVQLIVRSTRRVQLTPAGSLLLAGATKALDLIQKSFEEARRAARGEAGQVTIAFREAASVTLVPGILRLHQRKYPDVTLGFDSLDDSTQVPQLLAGKLDIGLVRSYFNVPGLVCERVLEEAYCLALPASHPLAGNASIRLEEVSGERFVMWQRRHNDRPYDEIMNAFYRAGFAPNIVQEAEDPIIALALVSAGLGISVMSLAFQPIRPTEVHLVAIEGLSSTLYLLRQANASALVERLGETIHEVAASLSTAPAADLALR